jgi:2-polyprenyl-3-methyl-5-hydroxy-6-metoxy-1,4-benzoquinol methylase
MSIKKKTGKFLEKIMIEELRKKILMIVNKRVEKGWEVLDIGCGTRGSFDLDKIKARVRITGYDLRESVLRKFKKKYRNIVKNTGICNVEKDKINGKYEMITFGGVIQYISNPEDTVKKLCNSLKPEGLLIISTVNRDSLLRRLGIIGKSPKLNAGEKNIYSIPEFRALVEKNGFQIQEQRGSDFFPLGFLSSNIVLVCKKLR